MTPTQRQRRDQVEAAIRLAEPFLNLVLVAGERIARLAERGDDDYYPPQRGNLPSTSSSGKSSPERRDRGTHT
ncbi:MAG TPA: hypothetical protein VGR10_02690 [Thermoleophilaceae bacterium]|nr:hypothetical protein [Thermoleophilaceae bacterium]